MKSYLITITCADKVFKLIIKAPTKGQAKRDAEPTIQNELTSRIFRRKISVMA